MGRKPSHDAGHRAGSVRGSSVDRWMSRMVLVGGSFVALGAVGLVVYTESQKSERKVEAPQAPSVEERSKPWFAEFEPDVDQIIAACTPLVSGTRSVVVFSNGTCVLVDEEVEDPVEFARGVIILSASKAELPIATPVDGGHLLVTHHAPVHHYFFSDQFERQHRVFSRWRESLRQGELEELKAKGLSEKQIKGALLARDLLRRDASDPRPLRLLKARPTGQAVQPAEETGATRTAGPASQDSPSSRPSGMPGDPPPSRSPSPQ